MQPKVATRQIPRQAFLNYNPTQFLNILLCCHLFAAMMQQAPCKLTKVLYFYHINVKGANHIPDRDVLGTSLC
jgi:hypothetical protein